MTAYDPNNIFAKILRGEIPCHKLYENEHTLAFMDVMPMVDGHCLVVPKVAARNLLDVSPGDFTQVMTTAQKLARAAMVAMKAEGCQIRQYNEAAAGQTVFHLHVHILPLKAGDTLRPHSSKMADHAMLAKQAELIRAALD
jgi:histidine triad (HIT) family protein